PGRARLRPDEDEERVGGDGGDVAFLIEHEPLEPAVAVTPPDAGREPHVDVRTRGDLAHEVLRHAPGERRCAYDEGDLRCVPAQVDRRLPGRVPPTDDEDAPARELLPVGRRRAVEDTASGELVELIDPEAPVRDTAGEDDTRRLRVHPTGDREHVPPAGEGPEGLPPAQERERRAEAPGLLVRARGEPGPRDPAREAEVVANPGARARLPADRLALDDER